MNLRDLGHFLAVVEHGTIGRAAASVGITQSGLTKSIQRLESEFGVPLFERLPRGTEPTEMGWTLVRRARLVHSEIRDARAEIRSLVDGYAGSLKIGAGPSWLDRFLPLAIGRLVAARPGVNVSVTSGFSSDLMELLMQGDLDLVIAALDEVEAELDITMRPLTFDELGIIVRKGHPLSRGKTPEVDTLDEYGWILPHREMLQRQRLEALYRLHGKALPRPKIESNSMHFILAMVRNTDYVSFATSKLIDSQYLHEIVSLEVPKLRWRREAGVMYRRGALLSNLAQSLIDELEQICRQDGQN